MPSDLELIQKAAMGDKSVVEWKEQRTLDLQAETRQSFLDDYDTKVAQGTRVELSASGLNGQITKHMKAKANEIAARVEEDAQTMADPAKWMAKEVQQQIIARQTHKADVYGKVKLDRAQFMDGLQKAWGQGEDIMAWLQSPGKVSKPHMLAASLEHRIGSIESPQARRLLTATIEWAHKAPLVDKDISQANTIDRVYESAIAISGDVRWANQLRSRFAMAETKLEYDRVVEQLTYKANERFNLGKANSAVQEYLSKVGEGAPLPYGPEPSFAPAQPGVVSATVEEAMAKAEATIPKPLKNKNKSITEADQNLYAQRVAAVRESARAEFERNQVGPLPGGEYVNAAGDTVTRAKTVEGKSQAAYKTNEGVQKQRVPDTGYERYRMKMYRETLWAPYRITEDMNLFGKTLMRSRNVYRGMLKDLSVPSQILRSYTVALGAPLLFQKHLLVDSARSILEEGPESLVFTAKYSSAVEKNLN
jgi:hypothetical protein